MKSIRKEADEKEIMLFKEKLSAQRTQALELLRRADAEQRDLDTGRPPELADFCAETATREYLFERASQQRRLLYKIDVALERIEGHTFGVCVTCGGRIPDKRLRVLPWAEYCVRCQEERERRAATVEPAPAHLGGLQRAA